jgi:hypothetical protein
MLVVPFHKALDLLTYLFPYLNQEKNIHPMTDVLLLYFILMCYLVGMNVKHQYVIFMYLTAVIWQVVFPVHLKGDIVKFEFKWFYAS